MTERAQTLFMRFRRATAFAVTHRDRFVKLHVRLYAALVRAVARSVSSDEAWRANRAIETRWNTVAQSIFINFPREPS